MVIDYKILMEIILKRAENNKHTFIGKDKEHLDKLTEWEENEVIEI